MAMDRSHDEATVKMFRNDPTLAVDYLNDVLASGDEADLTLALQYLNDAFGHGENLNPESLYRMIQLHQQQKLRQLRGKLAWTGDLDFLRDDE
jgi:DNA-binding phage protein